MAGVNWSRRYGFPGHLIVNEGHGHSQELTGSPLEKISVFGAGSRGAVDDGRALEREMHAGEFESGVFVTKVTRQGYLRLRERTAELRVASVTSFEARVWENRGGGDSRLRAENGDRGGALLGVI